MNNNPNLQELLDLIQKKFPKVKQKTIIKIIFSLKARLSIYGNGNIGFSRTKHSDFLVGETTLYKILKFLRDEGFLILNGKRKVKIKKQNQIFESHYCNVYKLSDLFVEMLNSFEFYIKKVFTYINPIDFVLKYFKPKFKYGLYKFKVNGNRYYIYTKGKFKNVIYGESENKIINPLKLIT